MGEKDKEGNMWIKRKRDKGRPIIYKIRVKGGYSDTRKIEKKMRKNG